MRGLSHTAAARRLLLAAVTACGLALACCPDQGQGPDGAADAADARAPDQRPGDRGPAPDQARPLVISQLTLQPNPNNVLSCVVSWRTDRPASSWVEFWRPGARLAWRAQGAGAGLSHRVVLIGMHAQTQYRVQAGSQAADGERAHGALLSFTAGKLPLHVPLAEVLVHDPRAAHHGWTLMTVSAGSRGGGKVTMDPEFVPTVVIYDMHGQPVWYHEHALPRIGDARYFDRRVLVQSMGSIHERKAAAVELDLEGRVVWTGPRQPLDTVHGHFHHHFEKLANGNYLALRNNLVRKLLGDVIVELSPGHQELWSWSVMDHLLPQLWRWNGKGYFDYTHGNSLQADHDRGVVYYNARHQDAVYKIDQQTGKVRWRLGQGGDFAKDPAATHPWFSKAHAVEVQPNGNILLYDNGMLSRPFSRAVEYRLDEQQMTAHIAWQYDGHPGQTWQTLYWGDADRLPNGNTLITAGTWAKGKPSRLIEVTPDHRRVWEARLPKVKKSGHTIGVYNSQRMQPPLTAVARPAAAADGGAPAGGG